VDWVSAVAHGSGTVIGAQAESSQRPNSVQAKVPNNIGERCPVELLGSGMLAQSAESGLPASRSSSVGQWGAHPSESNRIPQRTSRINSKIPAKVKYFLARLSTASPFCPISAALRAVVLYIDVISGHLVPMQGPEWPHFRRIWRGRYRFGLLNRPTSRVPHNFGKSISSGFNSRIMEALLVSRLWPQVYQRIK